LSDVSYERGCRFGDATEHEAKKLGIDEAIEVRYATLDVVHRYFALDPAGPEQSDNALQWNDAIIQRGKMLLDVYDRLIDDLSHNWLLPLHYLGVYAQTLLLTSKVRSMISNNNVPVFPRRDSNVRFNYPRHIFQIICCLTVAQKITLREFCLVAKWYLGLDGEDNTR
jgi:hypothetical protein